MIKVKNVSPLGDLDVPLLGVIVEAGEQVAVTKDQAERLLLQHDIWSPVGKEAIAIAKRLGAPGAAGEDINDDAGEEPDVNNQGEGDPPDAGSDNAAIAAENQGE